MKIFSVLQLLFFFILTITVPDAFTQNAEPPLQSFLLNSKTVDVYTNKKLDGKTQIQVADIKFPLAVIEETKDGLTKVKINENFYWLDSSEFQRDFQIALPDCNLSATSSTPSGRGAGKDCVKKK